MPLTLADLTAVRDRGALQAPPFAGAITDTQIGAALRLAYRKMIQSLGLDLYETVLDYGDVDLADVTKDPVTGRTKKQQYDDFLNAECYYAIAQLEKIGNIGKLTATGRPQSFVVGRETKTFAPQEEESKSGSSWEDEALRCLAPYLSYIVNDENGDPALYSNKRKTLFIAAIGN